MIFKLGHYKSKFGPTGFLIFS